jgi:cysteinyl-tRNA synthetase
MDIHSGGIDLQFPHHTNEIAQCAAHNSTAPSAWVKYWMHTGHLYIDGRKMSKSLKNFISIKDYLSGTYSSHPAMDFRIFCLQHKYNSSVYFSQDRIDDAGIFRRKVENYFKLSHAVISSFKEQQCAGAIAAIPVKATVESRNLRTSLSDCKRLVSAALVDDFDTPEALRHVSYLLGDAMKYASIAALMLSPSSTNSCEDSTNNNSEKTDKKVSQPLEPLLAVSLYIEDLLGKLGVDITQQRLGNPLVDSNPSNAAPLVPRHELVLDSLLAFRSKIRSASLNGLKKIKIESKKTSNTDEMAIKASKDSLAIYNIGKSSLGEVLVECDFVRDTVGPQLGVQIEDISESVSIWRPIDGTLKIEE